MFLCGSETLPQGRQSFLGHYERSFSDKKKGVYLWNRHFFTVMKITKCGMERGNASKITTDAKYVYVSQDLHSVRDNADDILGSIGCVCARSVTFKY